MHAISSFCWGGEDLENAARLDSKERALRCPETYLPIHAESMLFRAGRSSTGRTHDPFQSWMVKFFQSNQHLLQSVDTTKDETFRRFLTFFGGNPTNVMEAFSIHNPILLNAFLSRRATITEQHLDSSAFFKSESWRSFPDFEMRRKFFLRMAAKITEFRHDFNDGSHAFLVPMIHGANENMPRLGF